MDLLNLFDESLPMYEYPGNIFFARKESFAGLNSYSRRAQSQEAIVCRIWLRFADTMVDEGRRNDSSYPKVSLCRIMLLTPESQRDSNDPAPRTVSDTGHPRQREPKGVRVVNQANLLDPFFLVENIDKEEDSEKEEFEHPIRATLSANTLTLHNRPGEKAFCKNLLDRNILREETVQRISSWSLKDKYEHVATCRKQNLPVLGAARSKTAPLRGIPHSQISNSRNSDIVASSSLLRKHYIAGIRSKKCSQQFLAPRYVVNFHLLSVLALYISTTESMHTPPPSYQPSSTRIWITRAKSKQENQASRGLELLSQLYQAPQYSLPISLLAHTALQH